MTDITGLREDKRPQSSTIVHALLDRLEAAESECLEQARLNGMGAEREAALLAKLEAAKKDRANFLVEMGRLCAQCDALRTKIEQMERQEPVAWRTFDGEGGYDYRSYEDNENYKLGWDARNPNHIGWVEPLYALPGAQPAPSVPREAIGKMLADVMAVAVSNGANSVSMPDEYVEIAVWLQGECPTQPAPSVPDGWLRAIDEALVVTHLGVANESDTYEQAKAKLDSLIGFHVDVATDPAVNGGWKLAPIVSTDEMDNAGSEYCDGYLSTAQVVWDAMLAAAPEAKP